ncbi:protoporphyrinogen/coproporphyrinogen oxidase [Entomobacter blattae]|uniref:Amine oxidase domain-containing protein n=1 Tax=Entomobacter blattae TaxID=2762277 RepID=A0A7H1NPW0_9PROT|nr:NAD(P)-binding protein [Entomobacter blattae]QNT77820.1 hypothetical protein JGUZn3_05750 [Entomobacter blattae]
MDVTILGGGIAGLSAAYYAKQAGLSSCIYEAKAAVGGLLDNFVIDNRWVFDNAVHLSFATEPEVRAVFDTVPYYNHPAMSKNWDQGLWFQHPIQNNIYPLTAEEKTDLIVSFLNRPENPQAITNYREWLLYQYGTAIAEKWPIQYTRKYWSIEAENMGIDWIGHRMRRADIKEILFGAMSETVPNTYYVSQMRYPKQGGYRAFIEPLIKEATVETNHETVGINLKNKEITFSNGIKIYYKNLVSTLPLPYLVSITTDVPPAIQEDAKSLFATRIDLISIGIARKDVSPTLWFYIYDEDILASRVYSPSYKSPANAPEGCSSLQFEIYSSREKPQALSSEELIENCLEALEKMNLARRDEIIFTHHKHLPYGNVVFDLEMEKRRDRVISWVEEQGILLAGRFGKWDYLWSNQAFMSGKMAIEKLQS